MSKMKKPRYGRDMITGKICGIRVEEIEEPVLYSRLTFYPDLRNEIV